MDEDLRPPKQRFPQSHQMAEGIADRLIENLTIGLVLVKNDGSIVFFNSGCAKIFGYSEEEMSQLHLSDLIPETHRQQHAQEHRQYLMNPSERSMGTGREVHGVRNDGEEVPLEIGLSPLTIDGAKMVLATIIDITERKALLREKDRLLSEKVALSAANREKSAFVANMSHEIRTPLTAIIGFTQLLSVDEIPDEKKDVMRQSIERNAEHLKSLIDDVLDLSRLEAQSVKPRLTEFSLANELDAVLSILRIKAERKNICLSIKYSSPVPQLIISDPIRLRQILINLLGNSIKFTDSGSVDLEVSFADGRLDLDVIDTGCGIPEKYQKGIFKAFSQVESSATRHLQGTGLGLTLSRTLARALGGDVTLVQSRPGEGTTFQLSLFPEIPKSSRMDDEFPTSRPTNTKLAVSGLLAGVRLLVADDSEDSRTFFKIILELAGATVHEARNGVEAFSAATSNDYDVILLDMQMPKMNGFEAARQIRAQNIKTPIIALTAGTSQEERSQCIESGCDDFKSKPLHPNAIVACVRTWALNKNY